MSAADVILLILLALAALVIIPLRGQNSAFRAQLLGLGIERRTVQHLYESAHLNEKRLTLLVDEAFEALIIVDTQKRILFINKTARELFHAPQNNPLTLIAVTRQHELDTLVDEILRTGESLENQVEIKDNAFRVRGTVISDKNEKTGVILALQDVSELIRLTRARRDMVANFSHDLRTPISSVKLLTESLTRHYGRNPKRDLEMLGQLAGQADNLEHMCRELIDLSMIESGQSIVRMISVNFSDVLSEALTMMSTQVEQKKLSIINEIPDGIRVLVDPDATKRVLNNLIHNAVKFTPSGGNIRLSTTGDGTLATICVRDTGPGIPPQDRTRIFERFYQVDSSRSGQSSGGGSGLGLSIAKHIVEAQGGRIWAEPAIPNGASICFTIALAEEPKAARS